MCWNKKWSTQREINGGEDESFVLGIFLSVYHFRLFGALWRPKRYLYDER